MRTKERQKKNWYVQFFVFVLLALVNRSLFLHASKLLLSGETVRFDIVRKVQRHSGRCSSFMVSALSPGASGLCSSPGQVHCVVFLGKTLNSQSVPLSTQGI